MDTRTAITYAVIFIVALLIGVFMGKSGRKKIQPKGVVYVYNDQGRPSLMLQSFVDIEELVLSGEVLFTVDALDLDGLNPK